MSVADRYEIGDVHFTLRDPDASIVRETVPGHSYEPGVTRLLQALLGNGDVTFVDIGALYGYFALYAARLNPRCRVHAVEPHPQYFDVLTANVRDNSDAIDCHRLAFSDAAGSVEMRGKALQGSPPPHPPRLRSILRGTARSLARRRVGAPDGGALAVERGGSARRVSVAEWCSEGVKHAIRRMSGSGRPAATVDAVRYDRWAEQNGVRADVAKIDVHGAEGLVLAGMERSLARDLDTVLVEVHNPAMMLRHGPSEVLEMLGSAGFRLYEVVGFRTGAARIEALSGERRRGFGDLAGWTLGELSLMRMVLASKRNDVERLGG